MSGINCVKNYEYSILVKKTRGIKKNRKKTEKKCACIDIYTYYSRCCGKF